MSEIVNMLLAISAKLGYWGVVGLMAIESSFIPFPSEVVVPPAAYLASQGEMNIYLVILSGIAGSLIGATLNYYLAMTLGRTIVYRLIETRIARWLLLSAEKLEKAEAYFLKYGNISTFLSRLLPAIRQLISIPAGFTKMNLGSFLFYTTLGSGLWTVILAVLGYQFGANQDLLKQYYKEVSLGAISLVGIIILAMIVKKKMGKKRVGSELDE